MNAPWFLPQGLFCVRQDSEHTFTSIKTLVMYEYNFNLNKLFLFVINTLFLIMALDVNRGTGVWVLLISLWVGFILVGLYDIGKDEPDEAE
jgi:hypothetical protein